MTDRQNAKLSMYNVVISVLNDNSAKVATVPALAAAATSFKTTVQAISNTAEQQATITSGVRPDKNATRETLRNTTVNLAGILYAFAVSVNNIILQGLSKITYSRLSRLKDDEVAARAQTIHDEANANIASLPPFGITAAVLSSFQSLINSYEIKSPAPRAAQSQQVAHTQQLITLFKQADSQAKGSLDKLMLNFKTPDPEFFNTYTAAREIVDAATSSSQVSGIVSNSANGNPVNGVAVTVEGKTYSAKTNAQGNYNLKIPVPGTYTIIFKKAGFADILQDVDVKLGQNTKLDRQLSPA